MLLQVENSLSRLPSTLSSFLSTNGTAGGTVVPVKNINGFKASWAIQLGQTGEEQAEVLNISGAPSGTVLNTSGTARFSHPMDTPVYQIHYDSVIFLRSTVGTAGTASAIATVTITPDSLYTQYDDVSGVATYAYQTQYYNSVSNDLSGTSPWFVPGGPSFYSLQRLRSRGKETLPSTNFIKSDTTIDDWINEWGEMMTNAALKTDEGYSMGTASYSFGTAGLGTVTAPLFKYANKIEVTYDGVSYQNSTQIAPHQFSANDSFTKTTPRHYWNGDTVFGILPNGSSGTARFTISQIYTPMTLGSDELPQYLRGYTTNCIEYIQYRAKNLDQKEDEADKHYAKVAVGEKKLISELTPREQTGIKTIDFTDSLSGMQEEAEVLW